MTNSKERHRLSLIIATLGPSTDNEKELIGFIITYCMLSSRKETSSDRKL